MTIISVSSVRAEACVTRSAAARGVSTSTGEGITDGCAGGVEAETGKIVGAKVRVAEGDAENGPASRRSCDGPPDAGWIEDGSIDALVLGTNDSIVGVVLDGA